VASTQISLPYGSGRIALELPTAARCVNIEPEGLPAAEDPAKILRRALDQPIGTVPLRELARGKRSAAILIPGKTRLAATAHYVPALLDELAVGGVPIEQVTVHLATGTHEHHLEADVAHLLGPVAARVRCVAHACREPQQLTQLGRTRAGTPVAISTAVLEADLKILTGRIVPHYFAGFSGGRKALIPGVAGFETICANHRLTLADERGIHPAVAPTSLDDNPVHRDMVEAAALARPDFCLNTVLDGDGALRWAVAGDWQAAFEAGCRVVDRCFHRRLSEPVDVLVTSAGGLPHDCNFMQALKAVLNLHTVVRPGGSILWLAECAGGMQPGFEEWASLRDDDELERAVRADYALTGHNSIMLRRLIRKARVHIHSALPDAQVRHMGFTPARSPAAALDEIARQGGPGLRVGVATRANILCASLDEAPEDPGTAVGAP